MVWHKLRQRPRTLIRASEIATSGETDLPQRTRLYQEIFRQLETRGWLAEMIDQMMVIGFDAAGDPSIDPQRTLRAFDLGTATLNVVMFGDDDQSPFDDAWSCLRQNPPGLPVVGVYMPSSFVQDEYGLTYHIKPDQPLASLNSVLTLELPAPEKPII